MRILCTKLLESYRCYVCNYCSKLLSKYSVVFLFLKNAIDILNHHPPAYKDNIHRLHWLAQFTVQSLYVYCTLMLTYSWQHTSILQFVQKQFKLSPLYRLTGSQNTSMQSLLIIRQLAVVYKNSLLKHCARHSMHTWRRAVTNHKFKTS